MIDKNRIKKSYISRSTYTEKIKPFIGKDIIKILTGQRRVGKSYILYQLMDEIEKEHPNAKIVYINKELKEFEFIKTENELYNYIKSSLSAENPNYVFIDEIQEITEFEKALRSLLAENCCDLFCTGSNAFMGRDR